MTLKSKLFDALSDRHGNGSVESLLLLGEKPPCALRITITINRLRRMFIVSVQEINGRGTVDVIELNPTDEETPIDREDDEAPIIAQVVGDVMAEIQD